MNSDLLYAELAAMRDELARGLSNYETKHVLAPMAAAKVRDRLTEILDRRTQESPPVPVPLGELLPMETPPGGPYLNTGERVLLLTRALRDVHLGTYDARMVGWLAGWDSSTVRTIASLIERARGLDPARIELDCPVCEAKLAVDPTDRWIVTDRPAPRDRFADDGHPRWCARSETSAEGMHASAPIECNPTGEEMVGVAVRLEQYPPPHDHIPPLIKLALTYEDRCERWQLPQAQARALVAAVLSLLDVAATRYPITGEDAPR